MRGTPGTPLSEAGVRETVAGALVRLAYDRDACQSKDERTNRERRHLGDADA